MGCISFPDLLGNERSRAIQRLVICALIALVGWLQRHDWLPAPRSAVLLPIVAAYAGVACAQLVSLWVRSTANAAFALTTLMVDPWIVILAMAAEPAVFAHVHPFILMIIVGTGIRYGARAFDASWLSAVAGSSVLLMSDWWLSNTPLLACYFLLLALFPSFLRPLIKRVQEVRQLADVRARLNAAHEAAVARSGFLSRVGHELRSPLQGMVSALDVLDLRRSLSVTDDQLLIDRIRRASLSMNMQLRDLLTLAHAEAGLLRFEPVTFHLPELLMAVRQAVAPVAQENRVTLSVHGPASDVTCTADAGRIEQILTNLLMNAIRYSGTGGRVSMTVHVQASGVPTLRIMIMDSGAGIDEAEIRTMFEPDRASGSQARRGQGSGLGLAIVRTLLEHMGGTIEVASNSASGTAFDVAIPAEYIDAGRPSLAPARRSVLVVDDRHDVLHGLGSVLRELGMDVEEAASALAAERVLERRSFDVALLDVEMPGGGGVEVTRIVRSGLNGVAMLVGMSAAEPPADVRSRFDAWLTKPVDRHSLQRVLRASWEARTP